MKVYSTKNPNVYRTIEVTDCDGCGKNVPSVVVYVKSNTVQDKRYLSVCEGCNSKSFNDTSAKQKQAWLSG